VVDVVGKGRLRRPVLLLCTLSPTCQGDASVPSLLLPTLAPTACDVLLLRLMPITAD
jgi:hypothetical protein